MMSTQNKAKTPSAAADKTRKPAITETEWRELGEAGRYALALMRCDYYRDQRDEYLAALKKCVKALGRSETTADIVRQMNAIETGQDAIARAEGRAE